MTLKKNPTNTDIYRAIGQLDEKVEQVHQQAKKTNGRVTVLEGKQRELEVIAQYKKDNPMPTAQEVKEGWSTREKQLVAFITALIAIIATLAGTGKLNP